MCAYCLAMILCKVFITIFLYVVIYTDMALNNFDMSVN